MADAPSNKRSSTDLLALAEHFPPVSTAAWQARIAQDLAGADAAASLIWRTGQGIDVKPFYRCADLDGLEAQTAAVPGEAPFVRGGLAPWAMIEHADPPPDAIRVDTRHDEGATAVEQLAWALAEGTQRLAAAAA
nr:hypothetical protein [Acidobacteriota bacterium]